MVLNAHVMEGKAGSIGPTWPPQPATSNRLRGIKTEILVTPRDTRAFIDEVHAAQSAHPDLTRVSLRAFVDRSERIRMGSHWNGLMVEGILPVDHVVGDSVDLVYLGRNTPERMPKADVYRRMLEVNFGQVNGFERPEPGALIERVCGLDYRFDRLSSASVTPKDIHDLVLLYHEAFPVYMFPITDKTIADLLQNDGNIFLVARYKGQIVSAMIAEYASLEIQGKPIHMYELSDFATSEAVFGNHQGKKLMAALQIQAITMIHKLYGDEALIYAEDRGQLPAVVRSSLYAGMTPVGALPIHVRIGGKRNADLDEGVPGMETLVPVLWLPSTMRPPSTNEVLEHHGIQI